VPGELFDRPATAVEDKGDHVVLEVHNGDRVTYRRCRRKFMFQSRLRENLIAISTPRGPLWLGSGFHFALEDFHGHNRFGDPRRAFDAYVEAHPPEELPEDVDKLVVLGNGMLEYYVDLWLPRRQATMPQTLWVNGEPQVEVHVQIPVTELIQPWLLDILQEKHGKRVEVVIFQTFDKIEIDQEGRIWGVDYKTAKQMTPVNDLQRLPQGKQYYWGGRWFYGDAFEGMTWQQHLKSVPEPPELLKSGDFSVNKSQHTTYSMYRKALIDQFGKVPKGYVEILNILASRENDEGDRYIRRDTLRWSPMQGFSEEEALTAELHEMLDPNLPIYPNPTRDCNWDCPFSPISQAMDDGSDFDYLLETEFMRYQGYRDDWRAAIAWPAGTEPSLSPTSVSSAHGVPA